MKQLLPVAIFLFLCAGCASEKLLPESAEQVNLLLPNGTQYPEIVFDGLGLADYIVLHAEEMKILEPDLDFFAERGKWLGAQKVYILRQDTLVEYTNKRGYCWGCLVLDVALSSAINVASRDIVSVPNVDYGYEVEVKVTRFVYNAVYLAHPDSIALPDKIKVVEIYDEHDAKLLATAYFDWNEQLTKIDGATNLAMRWMLVQPIGFISQHNVDWESKYNPNTNTLVRYKTSENAYYRIRPQSEDEFAVKLSYGYKSFDLSTFFYGQHDWTIGSLGRSNPLYIDYQLDEQGRMVYQKVIDRLSPTPVTYHVRVYYRDSDESFPEEWRWRSYKF